MSIAFLITKSLKKRGKLNSVLTALLTNICHLKVRKHINSPIELFLNNFDVKYYVVLLPGESIHSLRTCIP